MLAKLVIRDPHGRRFRASLLTMEDEPGRVISHDASGDAQNIDHDPETRPCVPHSPGARGPPEIRHAEILFWGRLCCF